MNAGTYLENILDFHRRRVEEDPRSFDHLLDQAQEMEDSKDFISAIKSSSGLSVIAEIKDDLPQKETLIRISIPALWDCCTKLLEPVVSRC